MTKLTQEQRKANDRYTLQMIKMKPKMYLWKDNANAYDCSSGRSIKPYTMKGFVELVGISSKDFARLFIELPDVIEIGGIRVMGDVDKEKMLEQVWSIM